MFELLFIALCETIWFNLVNFLTDLLAVGIWAY